MSFLLFIRIGLGSVRNLLARAVGTHDDRIIQNTGHGCAELADIFGAKSRSFFKLRVGQLFASFDLCSKLVDAVKLFFFHSEFLSQSAV
jgi:hypothetical protein